MRGARFRDEKLCSCAGWRFNCGGAIITANTVLIRSEVVGVAKWRILERSGKGLINKAEQQKLQNSKGYAESPEFSPVLGLVILWEKSVATNLR